jgi:hypothetical protein
MDRPQLNRNGSWKRLCADAEMKKFVFLQKTDMTFEKTYEVQKDNRLIIKLPERFKSKKKVRVIIEDVDESRQEKIKLLRKSSKDPLFLSDINEINSDFKDSDNESL